MKKTLALLLALCMVFAVFGCTTQTAESTEPATVDESADAQAAAPAEEEQITVDFMNFSANEGGLLTLELMKELFENENPNIIVNIETFGYDDYSTQLQTRVGGGDAPDCFELGVDAFRRM